MKKFLLLLILIGVGSKLHSAYKIYAIGGWVVLNTNEEYDPITNTWTTKTPMPTARDDMEAAAVNNKIYVIGGDSGNYLSTNEEYDPATDTWATKAPMPTPRMNLSLAVVNNKIYAIGGVFTAANEEYDPATNTWTAKAPLSTPRSVDATVVNDKIYAIGEYDGSPLSINEEYDPGTNTWATKAPMPTARAFLEVVAVNDKIYALGGWVSGSLSTNEEYDPGTNTWATKAPMPTARCELGAAAVDVDAGVNENSSSLSIKEIVVTPNPFKKQAFIQYRIPECEDYKIHSVRLAIYDISGQIIKILVNDYHNPGLHTILWDGKDSYGSDISTGVYFLHIRSEKESTTQKVLFIKY